MIGRKLAIELLQQPLLLQIVTKVAGLGIVRAAVFGVKSSVVHPQQLFDTRHFAGADGVLQPC